MGLISSDDIQAVYKMTFTMFLLKYRVAGAFILMVKGVPWVSSLSDIPGSHLHVLEKALEKTPE